jgi:superfamily II DNA or RNA helicase
MNTFRSRDPRRHLTLSERRELFARAGGRCERCGQTLSVDWHNSHLIAWSNGGATTVEQMAAWCRDCNLGLGANDAAPPTPVNLRIWQEQSLPVLLGGIFDHGYATLHAAPGAGKTILAGTLYQRLRDLGHVDRLVVVVPNRALIHQWRDALADTMRLHLDDNPRDGCFEHPQTEGAVITYQRLSEPSCAAANGARADVARTLVIFDEVHHVGQHGSWERGIERFVGSTRRDENGETQLRALVLNMTGTLFRSSGNKRISTVEYRAVDIEGVTKYEAQADYSVRTVDLIGSQLRPVDLYVYGNTIDVVDLRAETVISSGVADLDDKVRSTALKGMLSDEEWLRHFSGHALALLRQRSEALEHSEALKLLFVADDQRSARRAADVINAVAGADFARLVISDEPNALRTLRRAAREPNPLAIVAVQMVTEGFDCPQIATIAYATRISTEMFIAQMVARAMRITGTERDRGRLLPAAVLIPDRPELRRAFANAMVGFMHLLEDVDPAIQRAREHGDLREPLIPAFHFGGVDQPALDTVVLPAEDEQVSANELDLIVAQLRSLNVPEVYAPRVAVIARRHAPNTVLRRYEAPGPPTAEPMGVATQEPVGTTTAVVERPAHPVEINRIWRNRMNVAARWWAIHGRDHVEYSSPELFQAAANTSAGIPRQGRDHASAARLERAYIWMQLRVREHARATGIAVPEWAADDE